ncbi:histidine kinase [Halolactibacillus alkaliphilus]|uniref:Histidine kinase n=1 Tax=Halolactibacillus alkaliphilus TaxID=442899 RepID=A0A511X0A7_9BACI|nr:histidine kinase [Halolactibacillus alkaliphilus]GEN56384.1 histidine kinase [Halolactibacillus alkaliphilus]GGN67409.1 histidine kinase [Halolactibacillus alkaliphilus]SFO92229.1 two-component system, sensor histidine kinase YesM [Halolactibacillus alkaliphilus]
MKKWFRRSLKNQLTVFILAAVLIPLCLLGVFAYEMTIQASKERAAISGQSSINQLQDTLDFIVSDIENISVFLIGHQSVQEYLGKEGDFIAQRRDISGFLSNLAFSKPYIENIKITPINGNAVIATSVLDEGLPLETNHMTNGQWWSVKENNNTTAGKREMITLTRPIRSTYNFKLIGYLSISLSQEVITEYLDSIDFEWNVSILIENEGRLLAENNGGKHSDIDIMNLSDYINNRNSEESFVYQMANEKATIFTRKVPSVNWNIIGVIPFREYSSQNRYVLWLTTYSVLIAIVLITSLVVFFIAKVFKPLTSLTESIQNSNPGECINTVVSYSNNEIGDLIISYNSLNERIEILMDEVKKNESIKRTLDLQALQSQINPHFLYNTLASVHWIALSTKSYDIVKVVSHLSDFLRFSLNKGNEYCTIEQEVGNLIHYLEILKIRYPNSFQLNLTIPEKLKQCTMLKLVLQPLIENSINHGFFAVENYYGVIDVIAKEQGQYIQFEVKDNGIGISEQKLKELNQQFDYDQNSEVVVGKNYGLRNVNLRLILHFGEQSKLHIKSEVNKGTVISFSTPIKGGIKW